MKIFRSCILLLVLSGCAHPADSPRGIATLRTAPIYTFTEPELDAYLRDLASNREPFTDRLRRIARQTVGQPYRLFLLGEFPFELTDPDPLYCLSASDCVTFVEQSCAMALADDWPSFFKNLIHLRYRGGDIGFESRNHFTEADWNINNAWLFEDVTASLISVPTQRMEITVDRAAFFARHGIHKERPVQHFTDACIARDHIPDAARNVRDGDIIELVRGTDQAPYVSHMGLLFHDKQGRVTMLHAGKPAVHEEPLLDYIESHPAVRGIKVLRARPPQPRT